LCGLWKKKIRRWIPIIFVWRILGAMEGKEIVYEERKNNAKGCVKVVGLVFYFYFILFSFDLLSF
jgi:hypothetical protein